MVLNYYKNRFYINIGIILIFFSSIAFFIIYPALKEISRVNKEITNERIKLEQKLALGLNIKKIIKDLEAIEEPAQNLDNILLEKNSELNLIGSFESVANKHNVLLNISSDFTSQDVGSNISQVEMQLVATGNYKQMLLFMAELESQKNYFNLKSISFSKNKKTDNSNVVVAQLIGNIYFKK